MSYIDFSSDTASAYKAKIDESLNLFREPPVSNTRASGTPGVDYEVAGWVAVNLTAGLTYAFKAHAANVGACNIFKGGSIGVKLIDGGDVGAGAMKANNVYYVNYTGANFELLNPEVDLSALNASNLASGTIPDARFPATLPAASGANLTALNASSLASGTIPDARFPAILPAVSGANLTSLNLTSLNASNLASGTIPDARFPATLPAVSGANLTALNATNISSGTLAEARLPSTAIRDGNSVGSGVDRFYHGRVDIGGGGFYFGPSDWSVNRPATGTYTVTHNLGGTLNYACVVSPDSSSTISHRVVNSGSFFTAYLYNSAGTLTNGDFAFMLFYP